MIPPAEVLHDPVLELAKHFRDETDDVGITSRAVLARRVLAHGSSSDSSALARLREALEKIEIEMRRVHETCLVYCDGQIVADRAKEWADRVGALLPSLPARPEEAA